MWRISEFNLKSLANLHRVITKYEAIPGLKVCFAFQMQTVAHADECGVYLSFMRPRLIGQKLLN